MKTYEQRLAAIKTAMDIDKQVKSAEREARAYRRKAKEANMLADKIALGKKSTACQEVARTLRRNYFTLIDERELAYPTEGVSFHVGV